jgi:HD superfamily phosphodiesterase
MDRAYKVHVQYVWRLCITLSEFLSSDMFLVSKSAYIHKIPKWKRMNTEVV